MRRARICDCCNQPVLADFICDTCGEDLLTKYFGVPITVNFSYGHPLDGSEYHFCNYKCLLQYVARELSKQPQQNKIQEEENSHDKE